MIITTKWNNWRDASIAKTNIVDNVPDGVYFFSANAFGLKGKLPGGKHSWAAIKENGVWTTLEITDIETLEVQGARYLNWPSSRDNVTKQVLISDRDPSTLWFGSMPSIVHYSSDITSFRIRLLKYPYHCSDVRLYKNNCNTYLSYLLWASNSTKKFWYVGFKSYKYWDKFYNV